MSATTTYMRIVSNFFHVRFAIEPIAQIAMEMFVKLRKDMMMKVGLNGILIREDIRALLY